MAEILRGQGWLKSWIDDWLTPRRLDVEIGGSVIGSTVMTGRTPQGSPLSPAPFTVNMSSVVWEAEGRMRTRGGQYQLRRERRKCYWPLSFIDDVNEKEMDRAPVGAVEEAGIKWDREKNWKEKAGKHLGVVIGDQRRHQKYRAQKARANPANPHIWLRAIPRVGIY